MPTISSMTQSTYMMYKYAQNNGASLFGSNSTSSSSNSYWGAYSSSTSSTLAGLTGISSGTKELVSSYNSASKTFYTEFDSTMGDLKKSAQAVKNMDFNVGEDALSTVENEDGTTSTKKNEALTNALDSVKQLVSDYNDAIDFFSNNSDVSKRVNRMESMFSDTTYRSSSYNSIGISVNGTTGKMTIDEDKLAKAITESPDKVTGVLGKYGLAGKAEDHVVVANGQRDKLFPSADALIGSDLKSTAVYTGNSLLSLSKYSSMGNLVNMMW